MCMFVEGSGFVFCTAKKNEREISFLITFVAHLKCWPGISLVSTANLDSFLQSTAFSPAALPTGLNTYGYSIMGDSAASRKGLR